MWQVALGHEWLEGFPCGAIKTDDKNLFFCMVYFGISLKSDFKKYKRLSSKTDGKRQPALRARVVFEASVLNECTLGAFSRQNKHCVNMHLRGEHLEVVLLLDTRLRLKRSFMPAIETYAEKASPNGESALPGTKQRGECEDREFSAFVNNV